MDGRSGLERGRALSSAHLQGTRVTAWTHSPVAPALPGDVPLAGLSRCNAKPMERQFTTQPPLRSPARRSCGRGRRSGGRAVPAEPPPAARPRRRIAKSLLPPRGQLPVLPARPRRSRSRSGPAAPRRLQHPPAAPAPHPPRGIRILPPHMQTRARTHAAAFPPPQNNKFPLLITSHPPESPTCLWPSHPVRPCLRTDTGKLLVSRGILFSTRIKFGFQSPQSVSNSERHNQCVL